MTDLTFLALIPTDTEHGRMLLADGECGARPPSVVKLGGKWYDGGKPLPPDISYFAPLPVALPLVFDGKECRVGIWYAEQVLRAIVGAPDDAEICVWNGNNPPYVSGEWDSDDEEDADEGGTVKRLIRPGIRGDFTRAEVLALALQAKGAAEVVRG